ncbi:amidohydrolase family protein [Pseudorhizobium tarimense]|uniref:amidohydrolase family protein n=1 Tax=Pseudorhizobium tarimense TaxID=1079109 RepID=UPI001FF2E049|nr:amidohydrolase family protein [Pseudorhizobium tarimense]MCJ8521433.1 amidohydrolase [Pseudorhizobium tarimense]
MTIDAHAHILEMETVEELKTALPGVRFSLEPVDEDSAHLYVSDVHQFPFPRGAWDMEVRLEHMRQFGFDRQIVAVCPQTLLYDLDSRVTLTASQIQNDALGRLVSRDGARFDALATAPMQSPELAARELERAMRERGLVGAMIGSNINGKNLDDPSLEPFWQVAEALRAIILVHPVKTAGADRQKSYYLKNTIGNPLDTTIAAGSLIYGGVMERHPDLRVVLSHGGGFLPYQLGRFRHAWQVREEGKLHLKVSPEDSINRFYYDTILHDARPLRYLVDTVGAEHVMLGSDYPFDMGQYDCVAVTRQTGLGQIQLDRLMKGTIEQLLVDARQAVQRPSLAPVQS